MLVNLIFMLQNIKRELFLPSSMRAFKVFPTKALKLAMPLLLYES